VRLAGMGRRYSIAFALILAGALAACGGDDSVTGETGGSGGTTEGGVGGAGGDASPDRSDAHIDAVAAGGDASPDVGTGGGGGVDASPDVIDDRGPDVTADVVADRGPDVTADVVADRAPDVVPDVVSDRGPDVTPEAGAPDVVSDRGPDVVTTPDATADVTADVVTTPDATPEASIDAAEAAAPTNLSPAALGFTGDGTTINSDAGLVTWNVSYLSGGIADGGLGTSVAISAPFDPPQNWSIYSQVEVDVHVVSGAASIGSFRITLQGGGDADVSNISADSDLSLDGDNVQHLFIGLSDPDPDQQAVAHQVGALTVVVTSVDEGGAPGPSVIEITSIQLQP
jgi:hypothetical protein